MHKGPISRESVHLKVQAAPSRGEEAPSEGTELEHVHVPHARLHEEFASSPNVHPEQCSP
jgi:hypothetical protein